MLASLLSILLAYVIGSVSASYVVGRLAGNLDMRKEPDGRISAAAVYQKLGLLSFACVVIMDIVLAVFAILAARVFTDSTVVLAASGLAAVCGHNWSVFMKFRGGVGATAIFGVLIILTPLPMVYGGVCAGLIYLLTHKSSMSTICGLSATSATAFIQNASVTLALLPLVLLVVMYFKKLQAGQIVRPVH